jgi:hypothetical protein
LLTLSIRNKYHTVALPSRHEEAIQVSFALNVFKPRTATRRQIPQQFVPKTQSHSSCQARQRWGRAATLLLFLIFETKECPKEIGIRPIKTSHRKESPT